MFGNIQFVKPKSLIEALREKYPDEDWKCERDGFGCIYSNNKDEKAWWCSASAPRYEGDDDSYVSEFWIYRKDRYPERFW